MLILTRRVGETLMIGDATLPIYSLSKVTVRFQLLSF